MNKRGHRRGLSTVELALTLPVVLLLTMGMLEYGWMLLQDQHLANAARQGARVAARADATGLDMRAAVDQIMQQAGLGDADYTVQRTLGMAPGVDVSFMVTVIVRVDYAEIGLGLPFVPVPNELSAVSTMVKEAP